MKTARALLAFLLVPLLLLSLSPPLQAAVTGRSADSSIAGTEKLLSDSSGTDTYILVSTLYSGMALSGGLTASGSTAFDFSGSTGAFKTSTGLNTFGGSGHAFASILYPSTNDGAALGDATHNFSDLYLASGAVIDWNNTNVVLTHSSGILTLGTGELRITTAGTNAASVPTLGSTSTLTNKTLTSPVINGATSSGSTAINLGGNSGTFTTPSGANVFTGSSHSFGSKLFPTTDDGAALGDTTHNFSDLFLATGAVLNYANGNVVVTHSSGILTMGTGELRITTAGTNAASVPTLGSTSTLTNKTLTAPVINGATSASGNFDLSGSTGTFKTSTGASTFGGSSATFASAITPATDDGGALGSASLEWSDLFLASGSLIKFASTDVVLTHSSGILTMGTGELRITTAGTNAASVPTLGSTSTLTNKTLTSPVIGSGLTASGSGANTFAGSTGTFITSTGANTFKGSAHNFDALLRPTTDDVAALGDTTHGFSDLFLASGGTLHFADTDWVATHSTGVLTVGTGNIIISTAGTAAGSVVTNNGTQTLTNKTLTSPTLTTPALGVATGTSLAATGAITTSTASAAFGFATGAGGAVTQATSRTTAVTMSPNPCKSGTVTTTADSMAAQTPTTFTVTDSAVSATDIIILSKVSGDVDTFAWVNSVGSGSFTVTLFNTHASAADTTAFVFNFAIIDGVAN